MTQRLAADVVPADPSFDRYARMVTRYLAVPMAMVTMLEEDRQVFPGADGLPDDLAQTRSTPLAQAFCQHVVAREAPVVVTDVRVDGQFGDDAVVSELGAIAYAGWPLIDEAGATIGVLCAVDTEPREWTREDLDALADLADACSAEILYRRRQQRAEVAAGHAREISHRSQVLLALSEGLSATRTLDDIAYAVEQIAVENIGCLHAGIWLRSSFLGDHENPDQLRFVSDPTVRWTSAQVNSEVATDAEHPVAEALRNGRPLFFRDRDSQNLRYPHLSASTQVGEARALMPLSLGQAFGTLVLLWEDVQDVSAQMRITIAALTSYVAQAVQRAVLYQERVDASMTLQSAMLTRLPEAPGMDLTARYRPAAVHDRVGGDWYDAVVTASGETNLMIGDVSGHDISAAAVMGELRSTLRAFAWANDDLPAANVGRLDEAMETFGIERFASLVFARIEKADGDGSRVIHWTNAGHFPPLVVHPGGQVELLDDGTAPDPVVGIDASVPRHNQQAVIPRGSMLLLYTDGLIERRDEPIDEGLQRLRIAASRHHGLTPGRFLDEVVEDLVGISHEDDVALLAVRFG
ncbi:GAF domain-containing protein [Nocardioides mangrovicus]|uniref:GAF domain-containing protein n=1 Tax=Nocardioides mangrovicus TaxID=2478913 RepID=A0A3L8NZH4_9ACTN|nr:GAF domain-containing SpoIIE family protein phosphatase [Nocardioides mangrovicus]RLV47953.1 GAF domain-containing protein [Nocardioides mangrovicus]